MRIKAFFAVALLLGAGMFCPGADLSDRIPASAHLAIGVNCSSALKNPLANERLESLSQELKSAGVAEKYAGNPANCVGNALISLNVKNQSYAVLLETRHITLDNLVSFCRNNAWQAEIVTLDSYRAAAIGDILAVDLGNGLFLFCEKKDLGENTSGFRVNEELRKLFCSTEQDAVVRGALITRDIPLSEDPQQAAQMPKLQGSTFSLQMTGKDGAHVLWDSKAIAVNEQEAAKVQLSIQQMMLVVSMLMGDYPELAQELIQAIQISRSGTEVSCRADLSSSLTRRLVEYISQRTGKNAEPLSSPQTPPEGELGN